MEQTQTGDSDDTYKDEQPVADAETSSEHHITRMDRTQRRSKEEIFAATSQLSLEPIEKAVKHETPDSEKLDMATGVLSEDPTQNVLTDQVADKTDAGQVDAADMLAFPKPGLADETSEMDEVLEAGTDSPLDESFRDEVIRAGRTVPGIYDETLQGEIYTPPEPERAYDETLPGVSALELARDLGEENQPTPVAAQTVFTATATRQAQFRYKWPAIIGIGLVVVVAGSIVLYQAVTPEVNDIPERQLVGDLELTHPPVVQTHLPASPPTVPLSAEAAQHTTQIKPAETPETATPAPAGSVVETAPKSPGGGDDQERRAAGIARVPPVKVAEESGKQPPVERTEKAPATELVKISRSKAMDPRGKVLDDAYAAFQNGDMRGARNEYEQALKLFPDNRDALLGLGAIAMKEGDLARGYEIYSRLYKLNPRDPVARAVLVNMDNQTDPVSRETVLKQMINDHPEEAFLYFALGNVYAAQSRWSEAQQEFFNAYSKDSSNPDYALNLAVSLDHIGQYRTALNYYNTALKLADNKSSGFDSAAIIARIHTLTTANTN